MAKRFIDTDLFKKPFMRSLEAPYKALWVYLLCECDHAGVWTVELDVAQLRMGMKLDPEKALVKMGGAAIAIDGGSKWFLPDFVAFQYGTLNPANRVHESVLAILSKYGIDHEDLSKNKPLISPLQGAKDKDKDKDKDTSEKRERANELKVLFCNSELSDIEKVRAALPEIHAELVDLQHYSDIIRNWSDTKGEKRTNRGWLATFRQWIKRDRDESKLRKTIAAPKTVWNARA